MELGFVGLSRPAAAKCLTSLLQVLSESWGRVFPQGLQTRPLVGLYFMKYSSNAGVGVLLFLIALQKRSSALLAATTCLLSLYPWCWWLIPCSESCLLDLAPQLPLRFTSLTGNVKARQSNERFVQSPICLLELPAWQFWGQDWCLNLLLSFKTLCLQVLKASSLE